MPVLVQLGVLGLAVGVGVGEGVGVGVGLESGIRLVRLYYTGFSVAWGFGVGSRG